MEKQLLLYKEEIGFKEKKYDETPYINTVKNYLHTKHHHHYFTEKDFVKMKNASKNIPIFYSSNYSFAMASIHEMIKILKLLGLHMEIILIILKQI